VDQISLFKDAMKNIEGIKEELNANYIYRGEVISKLKHNILKYDRIPEKNFILFDIQIRENEIYLSRDDKEKEANRLGLEIVPQIYSGTVANYDFLKQMLNCKSILGNVFVEGIVIKNYEKEKFIKILSEKFVEKRISSGAKTTESVARDLAMDESYSASERGR
jgi:ATP-dependent RNA circularization protein (DNA/RNA ligase family)